MGQLFIRLVQFFRVFVLEVNHMLKVRDTFDLFFVAYLSQSTMLIAALRAHCYPKPQPSCLITLTLILTLIQSLSLSRYCNPKLDPDPYPIP